MQNALIQRLLEKATLVSQTAYITLTAIHPTDRQQSVVSRHTSATNLIQMQANYERLMYCNQLGWGAYIGIGYRDKKLSRYRRGGKRDILALPALFADVDRSPTLVLPLLKNMIEPTLVILSGRGVHLYWFLKTPTSDLARAERVLKGIAKWLDADKTITSDQIMRLPLSRNTKPQRNGAMCLVLRESQNEYEMHDFLPYEILMTPVKPKPIQITPTRYKQRQSTRSSQTNQTLNKYLAQVILSELERRYGARPAENGWYACYCPFGHQEDRYPGDHAYFHPEKGLLNCFGRHKQHLIYSVASQINIDVNLYGGIYIKDKFN